MPSAASTTAGASAADGFDGIGGGWLVGARLRPGAQLDRLLRLIAALAAGRRLGFESLGLPGREAADAAALAGWRATLRTAAAPAPVELVEGPFATQRAGAAARLEYLAAVEEVIGRIDWGDFYQMNLCLRLHARSRCPAPMLFARLAARLGPAYAALVPGPARRDDGLVQSGAVPAGPRSRGRDGADQGHRTAHR